MTLFWVGLGGALGAISRYGLATWVSAHLSSQFFFIGTMACNVIGSFFIGILFIILPAVSMGSKALTPLLMVGFLGAFTTFSTFSLDTLKLISGGEYFHAGGNILMSVSSCLFATAIGIFIAKRLIG